MKLFCAISMVLTLGLAGSLSAQHVVYTSQNGEGRLVRDVDRTTPMLMIDGRLEAPSMSGTVVLKPAEFYLPARVEVVDLTTHFLNTRPESTNKMLKGFTFRAGFRASAPIDRAYMLIGIYRKDRKGQLFWHEIGNLQPGKVSYLSFDHDLAQDFDFGSYQFFLFSNGVEIMHSEMSAAELDAGESKLVARQIKDGKDRAPSPFIAPPPVYPAKLKASAKTGSASVAFTIDSAGRVQKPNVVESTDPEFAEAALETIKHWRFLPAVKEGHPVSTAVRLPFTFAP